MFTEEQIGNLIREIQNKLKELISIDPDSLSREADLGTDLNFRQAVPVFNALTRLYGLLQDIDLSLLNPYHLNQIVGYIDGSLKIINRIQSFSIKGVNAPQREIDSIINTLAEDHNKRIEQLAPYFALRSQDSVEVDSFLNELKSQTEKGLSEINRVTDAGAAFEEKAENILGAMQDAASKAGVSAQAGIFADASSEYAETANRWMVALVVSFVVTGIFVIFSFNVFGFQSSKSTESNGDVGISQISTAVVDSTQSETESEATESLTSKDESDVKEKSGWWTDSGNVEHLIGRFVILSLLLYAISFTARNYNSMRHNHIVNKHRANSMRTFQTFVEAAGGDTETKNAVLIQATQSIFSAQASGYSHKESNPEPQPKIIEILSSLGRTSTKGT